MREVDSPGQQKLRQRPSKSLIGGAGGIGGGDESVAGSHHHHRHRRRRRRARRSQRRRRLSAVSSNDGADVSEGQRAVVNAIEKARRMSKLPPRPKRITSYTLFTPIALSEKDITDKFGDLLDNDEDDDEQAAGLRRRRKHKRPSPLSRGFTQQRVDVQALSSVPRESRKVLHTISFAIVRRRLYALRQYKRQRDNAEGDVGGLPDAEDKADVQQWQKDGQEHSAQHGQALGNDRPTPRVTFFDEDDEDGDLALPPPALDFPTPVQAERPSHVSTSFETRRKEEQERYMSDVPLTPRVQMAIAMEFSRGFEPPSRRQMGVHHSPIMEAADETGEERADYVGTSGIGNAPGHDELEDTPAHQNQERESATKVSDSSPETTVPSFSGPYGNDAKDDSNPAWWLDISNPTYEAMTELSKLFPLHPLTVEDILLQEPREKIEIFDRLGYYFVIMRAIDERYFRYTSASSSDDVKTVKVDEHGNVMEMQEMGKGANKAKSFKSKTSRGSASSSVGSSSSTSSSSDSESSSGSSSSSSSDSDSSSSSSRSSNSSSSSSSDNDDSDRERKSKKRKRRRSRRPRRARVDIVEGLDGKEGVEGVSVGAINMYLVVFSHGIITFHFEDVSKHTGRVLNRLTDVIQPGLLTSDWIAHGLFDSIVDAFFPLLEFLNLELKDFEHIMVDPLFSAEDTRRPTPRKNKRVAALDGEDDGLLPTMYAHEQKRVYVLRFLPRIEVWRWLRKLLPSLLLEKRTKVIRIRTSDPLANAYAEAEKRRGIVRRIFGDHRRKGLKSTFLSDTAQKQNAMLRRISDSRKISTGLARLLQPKNDSIRGLRKHLTELRAPGPAQDEMSIYLGDVHDHIITLLTQMSSDEGRLGDIHFVYLSSIRLANNRAHARTDQALIVLIGVGAVAMTTVLFISMFGQNIQVPHYHEKHKDLHAFIGIVFGAACIPVIIATRVWLWMRAAKRKALARSAAR